MFVRFLRVYYFCVLNTWWKLLITASLFYAGFSRQKLINQCLGKTSFVEKIFVLNNIIYVFINTFRTFTSKCFSIIWINFQIKSSKFKNLIFSYLIEPYYKSSYEICVFRTLLFTSWYSMKFCKRVRCYPNKPWHVGLHTFHCIIKLQRDHKLYSAKMWIFDN